MLIYFLVSCTPNFLFSPSEEERARLLHLVHDKSLKTALLSPSSLLQPKHTQLFQPVLTRSGFQTIPVVILWRCYSLSMSSFEPGS